jgi:hypothetical protein
MNYLFQDRDDIDLDDIADVAKYTHAEVSRICLGLEARFTELQVAGAQMNPSELDKVCRDIKKVRGLVHGATMLFGMGSYGQNEDEYSDGRDVCTWSELPVDASDIDRIAPDDVMDLPIDAPIGSYCCVWDPDPEHPSNFHHEIDDAESPDWIYGYTADGYAAKIQIAGKKKLIVTGPGQELDSVDLSQRETFDA